VLAIRRSSVLFRLRTAEQVRDRLRFHNTGPDQVPGVLVMTVDDSDPRSMLDPRVRRLAVIWNANAGSRQVAITAVPCAGFQLHPLHAASDDSRVRTAACDPASGTFTVPGRTAAVFWEPRE
jgi:hypothetical protein